MFAVVVLRDGPGVTADTLIGYVKERIAPFKVAKQIRFMDALPRNQSGKLLERELRDQDATT